MKDYKEPVVEIIELLAEDIITTSGGTVTDPSKTGDHTETEQSGDILLGGGFGGSANTQ